MRGALDAGLRVPEDLAIVAYNYVPWAALLSVPMTAVEQPIDELATGTVQMVKERLAQPGL